MSSLERMVIADSSRVPATVPEKLRANVARVAAEAGSHGTATHVVAEVSARPLPADLATVSVTVTATLGTNTAHFATKARKHGTTTHVAGRAPAAMKLEERVA